MAGYTEEGYNKYLDYMANQMKRRGVQNKADYNRMFNQPRPLPSGVWDKMAQNGQLTNSQNPTVGQYYPAGTPNPYGAPPPIDRTQGPTWTDYAPGTRQVSGYAQSPTNQPVAYGAPGSRGTTRPTVSSAYNRSRYGQHMGNPAYDTRMARATGTDTGTGYTAGPSSGNSAYVGNKGMVSSTEGGQRATANPYAGAGVTPNYARNRAIMGGPTQDAYWDNILSQMERARRGGGSLFGQGYYNQQVPQGWGNAYQQGNYKPGSMFNYLPNSQNKFAQRDLAGGRGWQYLPSNQKRELARQWIMQDYLNQGMNTGQTLDRRALSTILNRLGFNQYAASPEYENTNFGWI